MPYKEPMQDIEPYDGWRELYKAEEDRRSPFYGREYSEYECRNEIYGYYIHPQWDEIGSSTLYIKLLYADYVQGYCMIELIGEWNDAVHNDIMFLKREFADLLIEKGINKFILFGENVLNAFPDEEDYYAEWADDCGDGWIALVNFQKHVLDEMSQYGMTNYLNWGGDLNLLLWQGKTPDVVFQAVSRLMAKRLG